MNNQTTSLDVPHTAVNAPLTINIAQIQEHVRNQRRAPSHASFKIRVYSTLFVSVPENTSGNLPRVAVQRALTGASLRPQ